MRVCTRAVRVGRHVLRVIATDSGSFRRCGRPTLPRFVG